MKSPKINDPIVRYQTACDLHDLKNQIIIAQRNLHSTAMSYGGLAKVGAALRAMADKWDDLALDAEIIEHDVVTR